jgi:Family of unknown function (DUF5994)
MNSVACGRRLARPVRLALAIELGQGLDGAWWPRTASVARELPELVDAVSTRLGQIIDISVNWSSLEGPPDLEPLNRAWRADPGRVVSHQHLMMIAGSQGSANLLVVPWRTSSALALMVLRQAATLSIVPIDRDTQEFRIADDVVRDARAESELCAQRLRGAGVVGTAHSAVTV